MGVTSMPGQKKQTAAAPMAAAKPQAAKPAAAPQSAPAQAPQSARSSQGRPAPSTGRRSQTNFGDSTPRGARTQLMPVDDYSAGTYTVRINRLNRTFREESKHPQPADSSIIEMEVVTSNVDKCPPGYSASAVFTDRYFEDLYFSEVKGFLAAAYASKTDDPKKISENDWLLLFGRTPFGKVDEEDPNSEEWTDELAEEYRKGLEAEGIGIGQVLSVTVRYKLRPNKHPITEYVWNTPDA